MKGTGAGRGSAQSSALSPVLALAFAVLLVLSAAPGSAFAETRPHYDLRMSVAWSGGTVDVAETVSFRNGTGHDLREVVFQVVPAYFGAFSLESARVGGADSPATLDGTVLQIELPSYLPASGTAEVELRYRLNVPRIGGRFGCGEGIMALGNFFPVLAVYREGWDRHQYVDVGDAFFTEVADFDVSLSSDTPLAIAATGTEMPGGDAHVFHAENVRDFALTLSDRYQVGTRTVHGVRLAAYAQSSSRLDAYLSAEERAVDWYSSRFGPYPYPSLSVVEIYAEDTTPTAMEYPGLIMAYGPLGADGGGIGSYSEYVVAHEVGHQWFYSLVGNDEVHDPWLDEALATYTDMLFLKDSSPSTFDGYWQRNAAAYRNRVSSGGDRPVNTSVYDYPGDTPYFDIVYRKGAIFLDQLRAMLGADGFTGLLRDYAHTYANRVATPRAFLDMAYSRAGKDFPGLVARYFSYGAFADGMGYRLDVQSPDQLVPGGQAEISYSSSFSALETQVWLDDRLLYSGPATGSHRLSLDGVEAGEYVLRLDLTDDQGALYQRAKRVTVVPAE
ncbi:MAG TPA: M1 family metallopeptidase [Chloroflexota bacterium]